MLRACEEARRAERMSLSWFLRTTRAFLQGERERVVQLKGHHVQRPGGRSDWKCQVAGRHLAWLEVRS